LLRTTIDSLLGAGLLRLIGTPILLISALLTLSPALADDRLVYAGFAFAGESDDRQHLYPISAELAEETVGTDLLLDMTLRQKLLARAQLASRVTLEGSDGKLDLSSLAFSLVQERVETQKIGNDYWVIVSLQANVLVFNKTSSSLLASYPLRMQVTSTQSMPPSRQQLKTLIRDIYTTSDPARNIFDQWLNRFAKITLRSGARKYLRVTDIAVSPEAQRVMFGAGKDVRAIRNQLAILMESAISEKAGVSVVPSMLGEAIGAKMALSFTDGSFYSLTLPEADFAVSFTVRDFVSKTLDKPSHFEDIYRVKASIAIKEPLSGRAFIDEGVYHTVFPIRPKSANVEFDAWEQYFKTTQSLIAMLGEQMINVNDEWLASNASRALDAKPGFVRAQQLLQELK